MNYLLFGQIIAEISIGIMIVGCLFGLWANRDEGTSAIAGYKTAIFLCRISTIGFLIATVFCIYALALSIG